MQLVEHLLAVLLEGVCKLAIQVEFEVLEDPRDTNGTSITRRTLTSCCTGNLVGTL